MPARDGDERRTGQADAEQWARAREKSPDDSDEEENRQGEAGGKKPETGRAGEAKSGDKGLGRG